MNSFSASVFNKHPYKAVSHQDKSDQRNHTGLKQNKLESLQDILTTKKLVLFSTLNLKETDVINSRQS